MRHRAVDNLFKETVEAGRHVQWTGKALWRRRGREVLARGRYSPAGSYWKIGHFGPLYRGVRRYRLTDPRSPGNNRRASTRTFPRTGPAR